MLSVGQLFSIARKQNLLKNCSYIDLNFFNSSRVIYKFEMSKKFTLLFPRHQNGEWYTLFRGRLIESNYFRISNFVGYSALCYARLLMDSRLNFYVVASESQLLSYGWNLRSGTQKFLRALLSASALRVICCPGLRVHHFSQSVPNPKLAPFLADLHYS